MAEPVKVLASARQDPHISWENVLCDKQTNKSNMFTFKHQAVRSSVDSGVHPLREGCQIPVGKPRVTNCPFGEIDFWPNWILADCLWGVGLARGSESEATWFAPRHFRSRRNVLLLLVSLGQSLLSLRLASHYPGNQDGREPLILTHCASSESRRSRDKGWTRSARLGKAPFPGSSP